MKVYKNVFNIKNYFFRKSEEKIADCYDSDNYENDSKVRFVSDVHNFKLKILTFSKYNNENEDKDEIINVLDFDISKVSVESIAKDDFKILYNSKPLKIKIISFCGLVKTTKDLKINKYIKIKNRLESIKTWEVLHAIYEKVYEKLNSFRFFVDSVKVMLEIDEQFPMNTLNYVEDCIIYFEKVPYLPSKNYDYLVKSKTIKSNIFCS